MIKDIAKLAAVGIIGTVNAISSGIATTYEVAKPVADLTGGILEVGAKIATDASKTVLNKSRDVASGMMK